MFQTPRMFQTGVRVLTLLRNLIVTESFWQHKLSYLVYIFTRNALLIHRFFWCHLLYFWVQDDCPEWCRNSKLGVIENIILVTPAGMSVHGLRWINNMLIKQEHWILLEKGKALKLSDSIAATFAFHCEWFGLGNEFLTPERLHFCLQ